MWNRDLQPDFLEKLISAACYLPMGFFIGVGYILFNGKGANNRFFRFNFFQSVILQISITVINMLSQSVVGIFMALMKPILAVMGVDALMITEAVMMTVNYFVQAITLLLVYGLIWAILGKYAEIPFISNVARQNLR